MGTSGKKLRSSFHKIASVTACTRKFIRDKGWDLYFRLNRMPILKKKTNLMFTDTVFVFVFFFGYIFWNTIKHTFFKERSIYSEN